LYLSTNHANLVQGLFDGGATVGKMMSEAFKTHTEAISKKMSYSAVIEHVRTVQGDKHANMVFCGATLKRASELVSNYIDKHSSANHERVAIALLLKTEGLMSQAQ